MPNNISIHNASENNLKNISLEIPKNRLVVVTGVSGSGKSSLVHDVIYREAENRYLGSFSSYARQFMGKMKKPEVEKIDGLSPAIAVSQKSVVRNPRSTVGTMTGIWDYLRLIFARLGKTETANTDFKINRNLFSFNSPSGACENCKGLGMEDRLDPAMFIADDNKTLREGALVITTPSGYIIYSQVTMDVLNLVCEAEGFSVDIPWKDLTEAQKNIVLFGSDKIEIPYGKHTLESRMRWSGITAKPRETGFYKGIIPVMETILKQKRNKNILRFVRTENCSVCNGRRLNKKALSVKWQGKNISELAAMPVSALDKYLGEIELSGNDKTVAGPLIRKIQKTVGLLDKLGAGYLSLDRESTTLSGGEAQRLRLATQVTSNLSGVLYIFDEPSIGLHATENQKMLEVLHQLRDNGNTVIVVEHDDDFIRQADHVIDIGPLAGVQGGQVLINDSYLNLLDIQSTKSQTLKFLQGHDGFEMNKNGVPDKGNLIIRGAAENNLAQINVTFKLEALNLVTGVSGAGKSSLTHNILTKFLQNKLHGAIEKPGKFRSIEGWEKIKKVVSIDQSPIGRTPRSNPATYTKLSDHIRDLFASQPVAKEKGWQKGRFSFNVVGGWCENCQGAGYLQTGMHFMGDVEILCEVCNGKRFNDETLKIRYKNLNVSEVLELSVEGALGFFSDHSKILRIVQTLDDLGLGYLKLGQRSTTLSGGEAQRVKLTAELARPGSAHTMYILDEPTTGLHNADVKVLLKSLRRLVGQGNTVVVTEHHLGLIASADHIIDLGPGSGSEGGKLVASGAPEEIMNEPGSLTGEALKMYLHEKVQGFHPLPSVRDLNPSTYDQSPVSKPARIGLLTSDIPLPSPDIRHRSLYPQQTIRFKNISTHNLKNIDIEFPLNKITAVTGVSGSGKSSLAFDTLHATGRNRFLDSFSPYVRSRIGMQTGAGFEEVEGLTPTLAINRQSFKTNPRSTVGTMTGIYDLYRLMFARAATSAKFQKSKLYSSLFSFNHQQGACKTCDGLGEITVCDIDKLISKPAKPLGDGAMDGHKSGKFYGDPYGQYIHTLFVAGEKFGFDFLKPWNELDKDSRHLAMCGSGDEVYQVNWKFKRGKSEGEHQFKGVWKGFANLIDEEYRRKHADHRGESMMPIMKKVVCPTCQGSRLNEQALTYKILDKNISEFVALSIIATIGLFRDIEKNMADKKLVMLTSQIRTEILKRLDALANLGLSYLSINRSSNTLSGGEAQRVRLAAQIGNGLTGLTIILDEPTVGLHPADVDNLMKVIRNLRDAGNTVVMVEHDRKVIEGVDHIIELGPGAGINGGQLIASGKPEEIVRNKKSITGKYLFGKQKTDRPKPRQLHEGLQIKKANANNLMDFNLYIPSSGIVVITGVSGSGKSSLVFDVIARSWREKRAVGCQSITGLEKFNQILEITQKPIAISQASNPLTYTGIFDHIRTLFSQVEPAKKMGLKKGDFSLNTKGGRCENCQGQGKIRISLDFVSDVWINCDRCRGKRYTDKVLACKYMGKNINDILEMSIGEAVDFFINHKNVQPGLKVLNEVGLGYLKLGQTTNTLSGGELQRLKLARELMLPAKEKTLYLFDEPTTGLHPQDVEVLINLFQKMADQGHTLLIIEHDTDMILQADWVIDLGPGGGEFGGQVLAEGTPDRISNNQKSVTGRYLRGFK